MSPKTCACCERPPLAGKLLCAACKDHAAELEHIRLGMKGATATPTRYPTGPDFVVHGQRNGKTFARTLALASLGVAIACGPSKVPCDAHDTAAHVALGAELDKCMAQIDACTTAECVNQTEADCNARADKRCEEPSK